MDLMKTEYEFLDLSDVKGADLNSLQCALFERKSDNSTADHTVGPTAATLDTLSQSSSTGGASTVSNSLDTLPGGEGEMAPHSPARGATGPPPHPQPYAQPPPTYPPPHHQWPVAPPNVYVSQVTANVNVHGYMGQYYQPPTAQYAPNPQERIPRTHRRDRRTKRQPSPPPHPAQPYYLQYPQYYQAAQAQGAPLYHLPVYQPLMYGPYTYPPYYPEYQLPVEGDADKGPDEYSAEALMEQEAVDAYYAGAHYVGSPYGPPVDGGVEYVPPMYLPQPHHPQPVQPAPHHHPVPHQFNVHAKNFVQGQGRSFIPNDKVTERRSPPATIPNSATAHTVDALPVKDLKISGKGPSSPKQIERTADMIQSKPALSPAEKPTPKIDPKPISIPPEKTEPVVMGPVQTPRTFPPLTTGPTPVPTNNKIQPAVNKTTKGPTAPFSGGKQPIKATSQTIVAIQPAASTPKAPFGNRQKREVISNRSPSNETTETVDRTTTGNEHPKREPPLPPSKAPMPISITLHSAGQPLIVTSKPPFGHSRKTSGAPEPPPAPQPPPPAPTASDFPPPPTPRNRTEPPPTMVQPQPQPAPGKSWASLFSTKPNNPAPVTATPAVPASITIEEPISPTTNVPPVVPSIQKPVAKVPPYDASPLSGGSTSEKPQTNVASLISYSEKTSVNAVSGTTNAVTNSPKTATPNQPEAREIPVQRDTPLAPPVPSSFCDDPNSYRMGEFLTKYQLDNRSVSILPRGLTNRSNYCYVNAILQALIACPPFYNLLKALPYQTRRGKSSTPVIDSMVELCYEFSPAGGVVRNARGSNATAGCAGAAPTVPGAPPLDGGTGLRVLRALRPFPGSQEGRQEDAEEFLGCLLNSLNDEMLELMKLVEPEEPKEANGQQPNGIIAPEQSQEEDDDDDDEWKVMGPRNRGAVERRWAARRTPVADIFRGSTRVRLHRAHHHDVTDAVQPFFTLQLDIERASNVKDALELLAGKDTLEGVNDAWQQLSLEELPVALLLHLKCFQLDQDGHTAKIMKNIEFPIDLKIDPKIMSSKLKYTTKQRLYKLFAVVYHEGVEAVKGHYVTDTYHGQVGWIRYDDSTVTQVSDSQVLKPKPPRMPYLLMYRRLDTLPPAHHRTPLKPE